MARTDAARDRGVVSWLLDGDPAIRWQTLRDLVGASAREVNAARARVAKEGWGRRLLDRQGPDGRWAADRGPAAYRGLYIPKWTSTHYTMLLLRHLGLAPDDGRARAGCRALVEGAEWFSSGGLGYFESRRVAEPCVSAMVLSILEAFDYDEPPRRRLASFLCGDQRDDGGWNCIAHATHSSFNTTCAALDALQLRRATPRTRAALARGREFMLQHQLFCSHRTGRPSHPSFVRLGPLVGWRYDLLRGLEHFARAGAPRDARFDKAISFVASKRRKDGRWNAAAAPPGALHFEMERAGEPSRWTTLRCMRVLRWWDDAPRGE